MTWTLAWSFVAEHRDFPALSWHTAERIDAALIRLAEAGRGRLEQISPDDPNRFRLRVQGAEARFFLDSRAHTILVMRIYRRA